MTEDGEVVYSPPAGFTALLEASPQPLAGKAYEGRVTSAIEKFRSRSSSPDDRRDAVRDLADVLERLRPELKAVLTKKDDTAIFDLANKFAIRHYDEIQRADYDPVWLTWMFYFFLATVHAVARIVSRAQTSTSVGQG